eukprot:scaffold8589_cov267-Pinguiococcus_pyrenoidosus.AAC.1
MISKHTTTHFRFGERQEAAVLVAGIPNSCAQNVCGALVLRRALRKALGIGNAGLSHLFIAKAPRSSRIGNVDKPVQA